MDTSIITTNSDTSSSDELMKKRSIKYKHVIMILVAAIIVFLVCSILFIYYFYSWRETTVNFTGNNYKVAPRYPDKQKAASILYELDKAAIKLINYMDKKYKNTRNKNIKEVVRLLKQNYDSNSLSENDPEWKMGHKAVTVNGSKISMALRKKNGKFYNMNLLKFVFFHELAHVGTHVKYLTKNNHHPEHYWAVFKLILGDAAELGLIKLKPYSIRNKETYAGEDIIYNPYFNKKLSL